MRDNVVVLCTGRCGSQVFIKACSHMTNFTAGHETLTRELGEGRLAWPTRHIEADNRLVWFTGKLDREWGDKPFYVHLTRDSEKVAASYRDRTMISFGVVTFYSRGILMRITGTPRHRGPAKAEWAMEMARDFVETATENIRFFLKDKTAKMDFSIERAEELFPVFWNRVGAEGNLESALGEFKDGAKGQVH